MQHPEHRERLPVRISAAILIEDEFSRLLLLQQAREGKENKWGPPAGRMRPHENPIQTAMREAEEETGLIIKPLSITGIYTLDKGDFLSSIGFVFTGKVVGGSLTLDLDEISDAKYFSTEDIKRLYEEDLLYKPEYNWPGINDWIEGKQYDLNIIKNIKQVFR